LNSSSSNAFQVLELPKQVNFLLIEPAIGSRWKTKPFLHLTSHISSAPSGDLRQLKESRSTRAISNDGFGHIRQEPSFPDQTGRLLEPMNLHVTFSRPSIIMSASLQINRHVCRSHLTVPSCVSRGVVLNFDWHLSCHANFHVGFDNSSFSAFKVVLLKSSSSTASRNP